MSAPPPGGSPPPQQPPTYPQYAQQPPQGYPPQYPPQQPYYPQSAPPPKQSNTALVIVLVVVIIVVVLAVLAWWAITALMAPVTSTQVTVTGVSFAVNYPGSTAYFGTSPITACSNCPIHANLISQFSYTLTLTNTDTVAHSVTRVALSGTAFTIVSSSPNPSVASPLVVNAGATRYVVLTIQCTTIVGGDYTLSGVVDTT